MIKKIAVLAAVGLVGAGVLSQTRLGSYIATLYHSAANSVQEAIPPEVELERVRYEIGQLAKDIEKTRGELATEKVAVRDLASEIEELRTELAQNEEVLRARGELLKKGDALVRYNGRNVSVDEAKELLRLDVQTANARKKDLLAKEKMLTIRVRNRGVVEKQLIALGHQKTELTTLVAEMEAELKLLRLEQTESKYASNNGSRLSDIQTTLKEVKRRLAVDRETLHLATTLDDTVAASDLTVDQILEGLGESKTKAIDKPIEMPKID